MRGLRQSTTFRCPGCRKTTPVELSFYDHCPDCVGKCIACEEPTPVPEIEEGRCATCRQKMHAARGFEEMRDE